MMMMCISILLLMTMCFLNVLINHDDDGGVFPNILINNDALLNVLIDNDDELLNVLIDGDDVLQNVLILSLRETVSFDICHTFLQALNHRYSSQNIHA